MVVFRNDVGEGQGAIVSFSSSLASETCYLPRGWRGEDESAGLPVPRGVAGRPRERPGDAGRDAGAARRSSPGPPTGSHAVVQGSSRNLPGGAAGTPLPSPAAGEGSRSLPHLPSPAPAPPPAPSLGGPVRRGPRRSLPVGPGRGGGGGSGGLSLPRPGTPRRCRPGVPCSQQRGCPGAGGEGRGGGISRRFAARRIGDASQ